ncbi:MAG: ArgR family transcriptional regulator [Bacteroidota bacterium]
MSRVARRESIRKLVASGPLENQESVQRALAAMGIEATQATISRDLKAIGAVKGPDGYTLPDASITNTTNAAHSAQSPNSIPADALDVLANHVTAIAPAAGLVVLKTTPGSAQLVALELDRFPPDRVVGTVAGDDTVLVAVESPAHVKHVCRALRNAAGLAPSNGSAA